MKVLALLCALVGAIGVQQTLAAAGNTHLVCYYDGSSFTREGKDYLCLKMWNYFGS